MRIILSVICEIFLFSKLFSINLHMNNIRINIFLIVIYFYFTFHVNRYRRKEIFSFLTQWGELWEKCVNQMERY